MTLPSYAMNKQTFPEMYERWLAGPLFQPWAEITLDEVALAAGDRVLDIACGTGIVARVASKRLGGAGRIVGPVLGGTVRLLVVLVGGTLLMQQGGDFRAFALLVTAAMVAYGASTGLFVWKTRWGTANDLRALG